METFDFERFYNLARDRAMRAPVPARTATYSPVSHSEIIAAIEAKATQNDLRIIKHSTHANMHGTRVVGFFTVEDIKNPNDSGIKMMFGYRNSYDKSMSVAFVAGGNVWICSNGLISGDLISFKRKHTGTVREELHERIQTGIDRMRNDFGRLRMEVDVIKAYPLTSRQKAEVLGVLYFENHIITPNQLGYVKHELTNSEHFKDNTAWDLYNNVTQALKRSHPVDIISDHIKVHNFFRKIVGIDESIAA
jgi:hypothetical protein